MILKIHTDRFLDEDAIKVSTNTSTTLERVFSSITVLNRGFFPPKM